MLVPWDHNHMSKRLYVISRNNHHKKIENCDPNYSPKVLFSSVDYKLELDISLECSYSQINYFQNLIRVLRWIVEHSLRSVISFNIFSLAQNWHINQGLHIFKYLEVHIDNDMSFNPFYQEIQNSMDPQTLICEMKEIYVDATEDLLTNVPTPQGKSIQLNCFVDADHGDDRVTRCSQTGIILFENSAPLLWYSKRQNTVESSTFESKFVAL